MQYLQLQLTDNAVDYMLSAAQCVSVQERDARKHAAKYAVLHVFAGIELLLKARLADAHWSLIFAKVDDACVDAILSGDFVSVTFETTVKRLEKIGGIGLRKDIKQQLDDLRKLRNRIQHFEMTVQQPMAMSLVAKGAMFFLDFCEEQLPDWAEQHSDRIEEIKSSLVKFAEYVNVRMTSIAPDLEKAQKVVRCSYCSQEAVVLGDGDPLCLFCRTQHDAATLARDLSELRDVETCPECGSQTCVYVTAGTVPSWTCTNCGEDFSIEDYGHCSKCGCLCLREDGAICDSCLRYISERGD